MSRGALARIIELGVIMPFVRIIKVVILSSFFLSIESVVFVLLGQNDMLAKRLEVRGKKRAEVFFTRQFESAVEPLSNQTPFRRSKTMLLTQRVCKDLTGNCLVFTPVW